MLYGDVLYRDFSQITFPGTELLYFSLFKLFGLRTWIPNVLLVLLGSTLTSLIHSVSRRVLPGKAAFVPPLLFLTLIFHDLLDATHHWFSITAVAAALAVLIERRTASRLFFAGLFCGLAACFTQTHGFAALAALALFLFLEERQNGSRVLLKPLAKSCALLLAGFFLSVLTITIPFIWKAGPRTFFHYTLSFLASHYDAFGDGNNWHGYMTGLPSHWNLRRPWHLAGFLLVHGIVPLIYLLALLRYFRGRLANPPEIRSRLLLITVLGFFLFLSVANAPAWNRLYNVCFPALIVLVFFLVTAGKYGRLAVDGLLVGTLVLAIALPVWTQIAPHPRLDLSTGRTAFRDEVEAARYRWLASQVRPSEYFFGGFYPDFYFLLAVKNPTTVPMISPTDYTRPEEITRAVEGLEKHKVRLMLWASIRDLPPNPSGDHLGPLRAYLRSHYCVVKNFPQYEVWQRLDDSIAAPNPAICRNNPQQVNSGKDGH